MKIKEKFIVIRNAESGNFLTKYANNDNVLSFTAEFTNKIESALFLPFDAYKEQEGDIGRLAELLDSDVIVVEANYTLKYTDGEDAIEPTKDEEQGDASLHDFLKQVFGGE